MPTKKKAIKAKPKKSALVLKNPPGTKTDPIPKPKGKKDSGKNLATARHDGDSVTRRDVERQIHVPVDSGLLPELNAQLVELLDKEERLDLARQEMAAGIRKELKEVRAERKALTVKLKRGEMMLVVCEEIKDFNACIVKYVRKDTKEEVERREMVESDHQLTLNVEEANAETHEATGADEAAGGLDGLGDEPSPDPDGGDMPDPEGSFLD